MKRTIKIALGILAVIIITAVLCITVSAEGIETALVSALLKNDCTTLEIKAVVSAEYVSAHKGEKLMLYELEPYTSVSKLAELQPIASEKAAENMTFKLDFDPENRARLYSKYILAGISGSGQYEILCAARYIDNIETAADETYAFPTPTSSAYSRKKGLQVQLSGDAQELGVSHTVINLPVNEYISTVSNSNTYSYVWDGHTYYVNKPQIDKLDQRVKGFTNAGITVYLNIMLSRPETGFPADLRHLYFDNAFETSYLYGFNIMNRDCALTLEGFLDFIAERYTRADKMYGFAGAFIFGYQVNSNRTWNNMGALPMNNYLDYYIAGFRIADTALRSNYANGRVYVSLANNFNAWSSDITVLGDSTMDYAGRDFLETFNTKLAYSGNLPWNLAINPYPSDPENSRVWNDSKATDDYNTTEFITMKNIELICDALGGEAFLYNGRKRTVLVSEFGVSGVNYREATAQDGIALVDDDTTADQAASFVYAYYKALFNPDIEALIWHRHVDHLGEDGLYYGLWTADSESIVTPAKKKTIYSVFEYIDTERSLDVANFALKIIGAGDWSEVIPGFKDSERLALRDTIETIPVLADDIGRGYSDELLYDFSRGELFGFDISDNADYIELRRDSDSGKSMLYATMSTLYPTEYMGICRIYESGNGLSLKNTDYLTINIKVEAPSDVRAVNLMLRLGSEGSATANQASYEGLAQITPNEWEEVTFKIDGFTLNRPIVDSMRIWIKPYDDKLHTGNYGMWISDMSVYTKSNSGIITFVIIAILVIAVLAFAAFFYSSIRERFTEYMARQRNAARSKALKERTRSRREVEQERRREANYDNYRQYLNSQQTQQQIPPIQPQTQQRPPRQQPQGQYGTQTGQYDTRSGPYNTQSGQISSQQTGQYNTRSMPYGTQSGQPGSRPQPTGQTGTPQSQYYNQSGAYTATGAGTQPRQPRRTPQRRPQSGSGAGDNTQQGNIRRAPQQPDSGYGNAGQQFDDNRGDRNR